MPESPRKRAKLEKAASSALQVEKAASSGALPGEKFDASIHAGMLGLPPRAPSVPVRPTEKDIIAGKAPLLGDWICELWSSVTFRLSVFLYENESLRTPLHMQRTTPFVAAKGATKSAATTFKEAWDMKNCVTSLRSNGLYEASMTVWQFLAGAKEWNGADLAIDTVSWRQFEACAGLWGKAALDSSSENSEQTRYVYPGYLPTCVRSVEIVEEMLKGDMFFRDLPACGGHAVMWSLIGALDAALSDGDSEQILKLYEASVTVTVRMRVAPTKAQLQLDSMGYIDVLRVLNLAAGAISFFEFALSVLRFEQITGQESGPELVKKLEVLGINFKGKPVNKNLVYSILSVVGLADDGAGKEAVRYLERISPSVFSDHSKIQRSFQTVKKNTGPDEWKDSLVILVESIGASLLSGDVAEEKYSVDFLVPKGRRQKGYVQGILTKRKFFKWFIDEQIGAAASGASSLLTTIGLMLIKDKCWSVRVFWYNFYDDESNDEDVGSFSLDTTHVAKNIPGSHT